MAVAGECIGGREAGKQRAGKQGISREAGLFASVLTAFGQAQPDHLRGVQPSNALFLSLAKVEEIQEWHDGGSGLATRYRLTGWHRRALVR
ncbi:hypothetical protein MMC07_006173 [Pseudocyphellaria aurata]|nr:hypothetical protein [Pseudocyphellaria aurata]